MAISIRTARQAARPAPRQDRVRIELPVSAEQLVSGLVVVSVGLVTVSFALGIAVIQDWIEPSSRVVRLLYADLEQSLTAWYESGLLLLCAFLALTIACRARAHVAAWTSLAIAFAAMSADEIVELHEKIGDRIHTLLDTGGPLRYAFVIPGTILLIAAIAIFRPLLRSLDRRVRQLFVVATALFFGAVLVLEAVGSQLSDSGGVATFPYVAVANMEELLELAGVSVFILALAVHLRLSERR
jgi:hypothetical protein